MSLRECALAMADCLRGIPSDPEIDVRTSRVIVRSRTWDSGKIQTGAPTITDLEILPRPRVLGIAGDPTIRVKWITPYYAGPPSGGYTPAQLNPSDAPGLEWNYIVIFPDGLERPFKLMRLDTTHALNYALELVAIDRKVPF